MAVLFKDLFFPQEQPWMDTSMRQEVGLGCGAQGHRGHPSVLVGARAFPEDARWMRAPVPVR